MKIPRVYTKGVRYYYVQDLEARHARTGRPKQKWHPLSRIDEGDAALHRALAALLGQPPRRDGNMPELLTEFRKAHLPGLTHDVRGEYDRMYDVIATAFAEFDAAQVEPGDVLRFLAEWQGKPNTRGKYKARLSTFFAWCVLSSHTGVKVNPCREIRLPAPPRRRGGMTAEIFWRLHDALTPMGKCFLELMYLTRQRPTEIRLLRDSAIGADWIDFRPTKTAHTSGEEVRVRITPEIRAALDRARALRPQPKVVDLQRRRDPYIIQARDGEHYTKNGLYEVWRDACDIADCKGITTRHVRPFALHAMEAAGYNLREIQKAAAHATVTTTEGYLEQHRDRLSDARIGLPERKA